MKVIFALVGSVVLFCKSAKAKGDVGEPKKEAREFGLRGVKKSSGGVGFDCPGPDDGPQKLESGSFRLKKSQEGMICTLRLVDEAGQGFPVARSFGGDGWELEDFFSSAEEVDRLFQAKIECTDIACDIYLPSPPRGFFYIISGFRNISEDQLSGKRVFAVDSADTQVQFSIDTESGPAPSELQRQLASCKDVGGSCRNNGHCCGTLICSSRQCVSNGPPGSPSPTKAPANSPPSNCLAAGAACNRRSTCCYGPCSAGNNGICPDAPAPTRKPTLSPTDFPTKAPTPSPTRSPTIKPTSSPTKAPTPSPTSASTLAPTNHPTKAPTSTTSDVVLAVSSPGELLILVDANGLHGGRSYDGRPWESVPPLYQKFGCNGSTCTAFNAPPGHTVVSRIPIPLTSKEKTSRLLIQTTFGPSEELIAAVDGTTPQAWIASQMQLEPTLFRTHARERSNQGLRQASVLFGTRDPCLAGSRWSRFSFSKQDRGKLLEVSGTSPWVLKVDGVPRTELSQDPNLVSTYALCEVAEYIGGDLTLSPIDQNGVPDCTMNNLQLKYIPNPAITLSGSIPTGSLVELSPPVSDTKLLGQTLTACSFAAAGPIFLRDSANPSNVYIGDRRLESIDNTPGSTALKPNSRTKTCPTAPKTFLNEDTCQIRGDCSPPVYSSVNFQLDDTNIREFYTRDGLFVYQISDLKLDDSERPVVTPCSTSKASHRWIRRDPSTELCVSETPGLDPNIKNILATAIAAASSTGGRVIDVPSNTYTCTDTSNAFRGASISVAGKGCFTHSHPDEWSVYDFSPWILLHPGNKDAFLQRKPHPIAKHAESATGQTVLNYPSWKPMAFWEDKKWVFQKLGHYMDTVDFSVLHPEVQGPNVAAYLGASKVGFSSPQMEVCGSPGEVANDPMKGHQYLNIMSADQGEVMKDTLDQDHERWHSNEMLWASVVAAAPDQLRQRVAWALSQIFVVTENDIGQGETVENWSGAYMDIFVRHAFGNFHDILKEISYSPMMATMLTYLGNRAFAANIEEGNMLFPDENFAREIMQLFTIGLWKLNSDGTRVLDEQGKPVPTYDNKDIMATARGWTGLEKQASRSNYEAWDHYYWATNNIDPMRILTKDTHDVFPKLWLDDNGRKHVGDSYTRCDSLPDKAWLKKGAKYRYLGTRGVPDLARADPEWWSGDASWIHKLKLDPNSQLYGALCNKDGNGYCQFESQVVLQQNLNCTGSCTASKGTAKGASCECSIDEPRVVRMEGVATGSPNAIYYEYIREPCVRLGFPEAGNSFTVKANEVGEDAMCGDANLPEAGTACCPAGYDVNNPSDLTDATSLCVFIGERATFYTAEERCANAGLAICPWNDATVANWLGVQNINTACSNGKLYNSWPHEKAGLEFTWTNSPCTVKAQINADGAVAIVHDVAPLTNPVKKRVALDSGTYFRVLWENGFPTSTECASIGCSVHGSTCLCDAQVSTVAAFTGTPPPLVTLLAELHIGAPDPSSFELNTYGSPVSAQGYNIYYKSSVLDIDTIFEVGGKFFLNMKSTVAVGGKKFRNPPMLNSPVDQTRRDALYEIDQMLDYYVKHSNVAPFIASRLIQRLVTSNPSPNYVSVVADAFRTGSYDGFGSGNYGDMAATIAAIFLHPEARSEVLDTDPTYGSLREPLLILLHFFRAMKLETADGREREIRMRYLRDHLGQDPFNAPSVFSYFLPDNRPVGAVNDAQLYSPEAQVLDSPRIVGAMNGYASLAKFGLNEAQWWTGFGDNYERYNVVDHPEAGSFSETLAGDLDPSVESPLRLRWTPTIWATTLPGPSSSRTVFQTVASEVVKEMELLLTPGRLDGVTRTLIENGYMEAASKILTTAQDANTEGLRMAQQLYAMAPEFHIMNILRDPPVTANPIERPGTTYVPPTNPPPVTGYKAIVYLFLAGGADSYNLVTPFPSCGSLHTEYESVRSNMKIPANELLQINDSSGSQPCQFFGLHPSLSAVQQMYNIGNAAVVANVGPLVEPLDKFQFEAESKLFPPALFAHNTQTDITQTVAPLDSTANGMLGRLGDAINEQNCFEVNGGTDCSEADIFDGYSISGTPVILDGAPGVSRVADVLTGSGVADLTYNTGLIRPHVKNLTKYVATSIFGETYGSSVVNTFDRLELLSGVLDSSVLTQSGAGNCWDAFFQGKNNNLKNQFETVSRIIAKRDSLEAKRDVFYVSQGGYDTHSDSGGKLKELFGQVNDALACFKMELEGQGIWANITVMTASEFGRTLTSNGLGTDHGWGGNHLVMGGAVNGGRFFGSYPSNLTEEGSNLNIGRGRLIPSTSWDSVWEALSQWFGLEPSRIRAILPNLPNFAGLGDNLFN